MQTSLVSVVVIEMRLVSRQKAEPTIVILIDMQDSQILKCKPYTLNPKKPQSQALALNPKLQTEDQCSSRVESHPLSQVLGWPFTRLGLAHSEGEIQPLKGSRVSWVLVLAGCAKSAQELQGVLVGPKPQTRAQLTNETFRFRVIEANAKVSATMPWASSRPSHRSLHFGDELGGGTFRSVRLAKARKSPKQATASVMRERSGLGIGARVTDTKSWRAVSPEESALAGKLKAADIKGRWTQVWRLYQDYNRNRHTSPRCCYAGCIPLPTLLRSSRDVHKVAHC